jgi:MFS family permease
MSGLFYTLPYAFFGLIAGKVSDKVNRKLFLGITVIIASLMQGLAGFTNSFSVLVLMRILHGAMNSATNPLSFSLISDYFPIEKRATANSLIQCGNYMGVAAGSMTILLISSYGWRMAYGIMAVVGTLFGLGTMALVREPERGRYLTKAEKKKER